MRLTVALTSSSEVGSDLLGEALVARPLLVPVHLVADDLCRPGEEDPALVLVGPVRGAARVVHAEAVRRLAVDVREGVPESGYGLEDQARSSKYTCQRSRDVLRRMGLRARRPVRPIAPSR